MRNRMDNTLQEKETYHFLVAAALQEELNEFYEMNRKFKQRVATDGSAYEISFTRNKNLIKIITYTPNKMGMPFNAAAIMNIVNIHKPKYTLFIGTCAGLTNQKRKCGDVLVPFRVFSYESGKYEKGGFSPDYVTYETGEVLRREAEVLKNRRRGKTFDVFTDEDFCSGAAVIDDETKRSEIIKNSGRKATGLDMEAFAIACINSIVDADQELLVIKGISDFALNKSTNESEGGKKKAMKNAADFAFELIVHLQDNFVAPKKTKNNDSNARVKRFQKKAVDQELKVVLAEYGTENKSLDVTQILNERISNNRLEFVGNNELFRDPDPGASKQLKITYRIGDLERSETHIEGAKVTIPR
jgi:nucleoside phosphorylase